MPFVSVKRTNNKPIEATSCYVCIHVYTIVKMREFSKDKVLNVMNIELKQLHLRPHSVTLCFTYTDDDDDLQTGAEVYWVQYL